MGDQNEDQEAQRLREFEERWNKEWGPEISPARKLASGAIIIGALVGLVVLAFLAVPD